MKSGYGRRARYQEQTTPPPATTQATTKPSAPQARVGPYIETPPERETDPISEDWLDIAIAHGATESVDITGWSVRSTNSGKSFTIGTVVPHGSTAPIRVVLTGDEGGAFIHTVGSPSKSYVGEGNEYHLYFGEPKIAWGKEHDTIQLVNPSGVVVDTHSY